MRHIEEIHGKVLQTYYNGEIHWTIFTAKFLGRLFNPTSVSPYR
jgi:hypothetical protein